MAISARRMKLFLVYYSKTNLKMPEEKKNNHRGGRNLVVLSSGAAFLAVAVSFAVSAFNKRNKREELTGSNVLVNLSAAEILKLSEKIIAKSKEVHDAVASVQLDKKNVDEAVEKLKSKGIEVYGLVCHVSNKEQRKSLIEKTIQKYGTIDVIVSNAAANPSVDPILEMKEPVLDKLWDINVKASILLLQDAAPYMKSGSSVVIISSIAGYQPDPALSMYSVTKTALFGLTKALAAEMAPDTRVNCVAPGFVSTHFASFLTDNDDIRKGLMARTMLNRLGTTEDMAAATAFLASDDASYITGETVVVAGGMQSRL